MKVLGPNADAAAPVLIKGLNNCDSRTFSSIISALKGLRSARIEVDPVLAAMVRNGQLTNALRIVTELPVGTPTAARILGMALISADSATKRSVLSQLEFFGPNAVAALPSMEAALTDQDQELRYSAVCALANLGINAEPAGFALLRLTNDANPMISNAVARALRSINPKIQ